MTRCYKGRHLQAGPSRFGHQDVEDRRVRGLQEASSDNSTKDILILAVTAYGDEDAKKVLSMGADFCMRKPLDVPAFRKRVEMLLKVKSPGKPARRRREG